MIEQLKEQLAGVTQERDDILRKEENICKLHQMGDNTWEHTGGDGVEYETWYCTRCVIHWETPMEISRFWNKSKRINTNS